MRQLLYKILPLLFLLPVLAGAQVIDNTLSFKNITEDKYMRASYDNDLFYGTDQYYSQGMQLELVAPWVKDFPLSKVLLHPFTGYTRYGLGIEHDLYTPSNLLPETILFGDRPFAACLSLKTFDINTDPVHKQRFSTTLTTGIIGPVALGGQMQMAAHQVIKSTVPNGWGNQIKNDAIINYQADYEKQLLCVGHILSLDADGTARAGTLSDKAGVGGTLMIGYFDSPYGTANTSRNSFRFYAYAHPEVDAVAYDATLQGGVFNMSSPYTISSNNIERVTFQNRMGITAMYRRISVELATTYLGPEFKTGTNHRWGSLQLAWGL